MKKLTIFTLTIAITFMAVFSLFLIPNERAYAYSGDFSTSAKSMCVLEKDNKRIIASHNENRMLPMASTTKIMTAITTIQHCKNLDEYVEVDDSAVGVEGSSIYLRHGELMSVRDLLYGLMLRSGNDSAVALAVHIGGSVEGFAKLMNDLAKDIGAENTHFVTPHGLDAKDHYTTAYDLALITAYSLNNPIFKEIVSTQMHTVEATNKSEKRYFSNKNKLLSSLEGCCGVKTGFTTKAGRCLVSATERDGMTLVCVVLNCGPMFEESARLLNSGHAEYKNKKIIDKDREIYNEYIIDKNAGKLYLYTEEDFYYPLRNDEEENLRLEYNVKLDDAKEGDCVGEIKVFFDNHLLKSLKLYTMNKIDKLIDSDTLDINNVLWEERINENQ
ncbi:MAG: D-alanyl-D-alanine carboxypeptidase [Clostridiales bacterium]|nr:D-alanyl-D-alanine carboxypeptidase [Clostridiales bacterium]